MKSLIKCPDCGQFVKVINVPNGKRKIVLHKFGSAGDCYGSFKFINLPVRGESEGGK